MPFNASGVFQRLYSWVADRDAGTKILAARMDAETDGMVSGLNQIIDGTQAFKAPVRASFGTAAAPSHSFESDPDTGIYRAAANVIGIAVNGVGKYKISAAGVTTDAGAASYFIGTPTIYNTAGSGTYTVPVGAVALVVECLGGGGGGGGSSFSGAVARSAGGGASGTYIKCLVTGLAASYAYTVGAGGASGASGDNPGSNGGDTTIAGVVTPGGDGGFGSGVVVGDSYVNVGSSNESAPTAAGSLIIHRSTGSNGGGAVKISASNRVGGHGGEVVGFGTGGLLRPSNSASTALSGSSGRGNGSGGSGGCSSTTLSASGGGGTAGLIIITPLY